MSHQNITTPHSEAIQEGRVVYLGWIGRDQSKESVVVVVQDKGFRQYTFYWRFFEDTRPEEHNGWCHIEFADLDSAKRAANVLNHFELHGKILVAGELKQCFTSKDVATKHKNALEKHRTDYK
ncbi:uncharacterized protein F4822DRAFT_426339 [Hypoxylon trugodes]|uniref:uncharacterized protein n=1 Tax=Hypoxylon trugodes TaxID=326681 RepID=UPI002191279F|nr:uncharacterized protein F4822DRAFT_426339 [Hypoxylon trugodes]KAI1390491.1 hypothetical protein F4822DRAFT_426339 [Hypoxylon trugodes]